MTPKVLALSPRMQAVLIYLRTSRISNRMASRVCPRTNAFHSNARTAPKVRKRATFVLFEKRMRGGAFPLRRGAPIPKADSSPHGANCWLQRSIFDWHGRTVLARMPNLCCNLPAPDYCRRSLIPRTIAAAADVGGAGR